MSRTGAITRVESPVKANIYFSGELGNFGVIAGEDAKMVDIKLPFRFIVLDDHGHKIEGKKGLGPNAIKYRSTLAHERYSQHLRVWLDNDPQTILAEGTWKKMQPQLYPLGARYNRLLYVLVDFGEGKVLGCIHLNGRAYAAWINATQKQKLDPCGNVSFIVRQTEMMAGDKGKPSPVPVFETREITEATASLALEMNRQLDEWLDTQFADPFTPAPAPATPAAAPANMTGADVDKFVAGDDEPFPPEAWHTPPPANPDLEDLPF